MFDLRIRFPGEKLARAEMKALRFHGTRLPEDYVDFLQQSNGGTPDVALFKVSDGDDHEETVLKLFLSIDSYGLVAHPRSQPETISSALEKYQTLLPSQHLPIAYSGAEALILMSLEEERYGTVSILYVFGGAADLLPLASSFSEFLSQLYGSVNPGDVRP